MDLDKLIQNYEDIIEISKQTTADLEKTLALLKSQKLNQEKETFIKCYRVHCL